MHHMQEWDVLAEEPLDAVLEPESDTDHKSEDNLSDACITWRGDGKYFATVSASGQGQRSLQLSHKLQHLIPPSTCICASTWFTSAQARTPLPLHRYMAATEIPFQVIWVKFEGQSRQQCTQPTCTADNMH